MRRAPGFASATPALVAVLLSGCAVSGSYVREGLDDVAVHEPAAELVDTRLLLLGDTGYPRLDGPEPVFATLAADAALLPERTWILLLGDNIYPHGLPPAGADDRQLAEQRLRLQVEGLLPAGARVVFVPGNHDYAYDGWPGMQRQREYLEGLHEPRLQVLPAAGCPGPEVVDAGDRLRLVVLDTQWWFQDGEKPLDPHSSCPADSPEEILGALRDAIGGAGERRVVVVGHHPLFSHGSHGGHFTWRQHVFPLVDASSWAWLPLPVVGSLYPIARWCGIAEQDFSSGVYEDLRDRLGGVLREQPVLLYASGHEHSLQVLEQPGAAAYVVTGAGTVIRPDPVGRGDDTQFVSGAAGYMRLDLLRDGRAWLQAVEVDDDGRSRRPFATWLGR